MKKMEVPRFTFVGDRGFYSERNLKLLSGNGYKFTIPVPSNILWQKQLIADHRDTRVHPDHLLQERECIMYGKTVYKTTDLGRTWSQGDIQRCGHTGVHRERQLLLGLDLDLG